MLILCVLAFIICFSFAGGAEKIACADLSMEMSEEGSVQRLILHGMPEGAESGMALLLDISFGKEAPVPKMALPENERALTLTVGKPTEGCVRVLIEGYFSVGQAEKQTVLHLHMSATEKDPIRIEHAELWCMGAEGQVAAYPISVGIPEGKETDETDVSFESFAAPWESALPESAEPPSEKETVGESKPFRNETETAPESEPTVKEPEDMVPIYIGSRRIFDRNHTFSVNLFFLCDTNTPAPAVICHGGGQRITLTVERLRGTSIWIYRFSGIRASGLVCLSIDMQESGVRILYFNGLCIARIDTKG